MTDTDNCPHHNEILTGTDGGYVFCLDCGAMVLQGMRIVPQPEPDVELEEGWAS